MKTKINILIVVFTLFASVESHSAWFQVMYGLCSYPQNCENAVSGDYPWRWHKSSPTATQCQCQEWRSGDLCTDGNEWNQETFSCEGAPPPPDCDKQGELAGIQEGADSPPGYESKCNAGCAITVSEYFQRTDNNLWVISWIYTGQECGDGDPLNDPDLPPGLESPDPIDPFTNTDTDDDGEPDFNDGDIDGDGIPNSQDPDIDGDGIPNEDDPTPLGGAGEEPASSSSTSEDCRQQPSCSGDSIQCSQLLEIWRLRCKNLENESTEEITESLDQSIIDSVASVGDTVANDYETAAKDAIETQDEIGYDTNFLDKVKSKFTFPACSDYSSNWAGHTIAITCSDTAPIRTALGYILFIAVVIGIYQLGHKQPGESK